MSDEPGVLDELEWRGLLAESTDRDALRDHLDAGPVTFYVGFDPTAPSLHFGNLVQLMVARALQRAGHHPLLLLPRPRRAGRRSLSEVHHDRSSQDLWRPTWEDPLVTEMSGQVCVHAEPTELPERSARLDEWTGECRI